MCVFVFLGEFDLMMNENWVGGGGGRVRIVISLSLGAEREKGRGRRTASERTQGADRVNHPCDPFR